MDQPFLISRKLRLLVGGSTTSTESYFLLEVWTQLKNNMTSSSTTSSYHIARRVGHEGARPPVGCQAGIEKNATGQNISKDCRLCKCRKTTLVSTFNCRTLSSGTEHWCHVSKNIGSTMMTSSWSTMTWRKVGLWLHLPLKKLQITQQYEVLAYFSVRKHTKHWTR